MGHPDSERDSYGHFDTTLALPWGGGVHVGPWWPTDYNDVEVEFMIDTGCQVTILATSVSKKCVRQTHK